MEELNYKMTSIAIGDDPSLRPLRPLLSRKKNNHVLAKIKVTQHAEEIEIENVTEDTPLVGDNKEFRYDSPPKTRDDKDSLRYLLSHYQTFVAGLTKDDAALKKCYNPKGDLRGGLDIFVGMLTYVILAIYGFVTWDEGSSYCITTLVRYPTVNKTGYPTALGEHDEATWDLTFMVSMWGLIYGLLMFGCDLLGFVLKERRAKNRAYLLCRWLDIVHQCVLVLFLNLVGGQRDIVTNVGWFVFMIMMFLYMENLVHNPGGCYFMRVIGKSARNVELPFAAAVAMSVWLNTAVPIIVGMDKGEYALPVIHTLNVIGVHLATVIMSIAGIIMKPSERKAGYKILTAWARHTMWILLWLLVVTYAS